MNIPEDCDFPDCDCPGPERCQNGKKRTDDVECVCGAEGCNGACIHRAVLSPYGSGGDDD